MSDGRERRRFFRVTDEIGLKYALATAESLAARPLDPDSKLKVDVLALEGQIRASIELLKSHGNPVVKTLELMNRKLNLLLADEIPTTIEEKESVVCSASLSACGIAFWADDTFDVGTELKLELTLLPSHLHLGLNGIIVESLVRSEADSNEPVEAGHYLLRIDFRDIQEEQQEVLIQHVLKCQSRDLRLRREARERNGAG
ncbi:MAG: hypothetical protein IPM37_03815 [Hahellaceae bacterium]|nr:hypothetical protein [Hahellaceae bacterium]